MNALMRMRLANKAKGQSLRAEASEEGTTLWLYDAIASDDDEAAWWGGVSPRMFMDSLMASTGPVLLRINSPGGSVFGAQAMVAAMRAHTAPITARIDSLAASAASVIAAEASKLEMVEGSLIMIHKAWTIAMGNSDDMIKEAELLSKIDGIIASSYARRSGSDQDTWLSKMEAETWFTANEAVDAGLADSVVEDNNQRPKAKWDLSAFLASPKAEEPLAPEIEPEAEEEQPDPALLEAITRAERLRKLEAELLG